MRKGDVATRVARAAMASAALVVGGAGPARPVDTPRPAGDVEPGVKEWLTGEASQALRLLAPYTDPDHDRNRLLNRAVALLYEGQGEAAEPILVALRSRHPGWSPALRWLARVRRDLGGPDAEGTVALLLGAPGATSRDFLWAGDFYTARGDQRRARDCFARAVREEKDLYLGWLALGDAETALGRAVAAREAWTHARALHEGGDVLFRLGRSLWEAGAKAEALRLLESALRTPEGAAREDEIRSLLPEAVQAFANGSGSPSPVVEPILRPGEKLRFKVKYLFLRVATLELENLGRSLHHGRWAHRIRLGVKSESFLFHLDDHFESLVAEDGSVMAHSNVTEEQTSSSYAVAYEMDPERKTCVVRSVHEGLFDFNHLPLPPLAQDGISVVLLARGVTQAGPALSVLTAVDETWKGTQIRLAGRDRIEWRGQEVDTIRTESTGHYRGPGGFSSGVLWASSDTRAIPYRSRMKVALGSVTLELLPESQIDPPPDPTGR